MERKEFNLSEKRFVGDCFRGYSHEDIKEFIKKLKYNFDILGFDPKKMKVSVETIYKIIDKLAGDKLT